MPYKNPFLTITKKGLPLCEISKRKNEANHYQEGN